MRMYKHASLRLCIGVNTYVCAYMNLHLCAYMNSHVCKRMFACIREYTHTHARPYDISQSHITQHPCTCYLSGMVLVHRQGGQFSIVDEYAS